MNRMPNWLQVGGSGIALVLVLLGTHACSPAAQSPTTPQEKPPADLRSRVDPKVREPAVAGLFYPKDKDELSRQLDGLLQAAPVHAVANLRALVCPHAGYPYSGPTAAQAYKALAGHKFDTAMVLAPSHYAAFEGASVGTVPYHTPLGDVASSPKAAKLAAEKPFIPEARCLVQRPPWWSQSPKTAPPAGQDTPHTWEHSLEVQLPFLQKVLGQFQLVPVVLGRVDPAEVAKALARQLDDKTVLIASSDLSHYHPYDTARKLDQRCVKAVCDLDLEAMQAQEACGKGPILVLMHLAKARGWQAKLLDYRNSGDTAGDKSGVVGYAAIAFFEPAPQTYSASERAQLLELARKTFTTAVQSGRMPEVVESDWPEKFREKKGCFVTLTKQGRLRGCIGHILPQEPLASAVMDNARNAALKDSRFRPVAPDELKDLQVEISVLTAPAPLAFSSPEELLEKLRPHTDGVVLQVSGRTATFLPQVWEQLPDKVAFLNQLSQKAGCPATAWREPDTKVMIYQVEAFTEPER